MLTKRNHFYFGTNFRDLSHNNLSGNIPSSLDQLNALTFLSDKETLFVYVSISFGKNLDSLDTINIFSELQGLVRKQWPYLQTPSWSDEKTTWWFSCSEVRSFPCFDESKDLFSFFSLRRTTIYLVIICYFLLGTLIYCWE